MLAINAQPILEARRRGFKPESMVLISLVGHVEAENPVVRAIPGTEYDWRWCRDLDVCVYVGERCDWLDTLKAIALCRPAYLGLWLTHEHCGAHVYLVPTADDVASPVREWIYDLDTLAWMDFQNDDFLSARTYTRNTHGVPHASHP